MLGEKQLRASDGLSKHIDSINDYINLSNTKFASFREEFLLAADMNLEELGKLTQQELFDTAYILYSYASYIQDEINKNKVALTWCDSEIENMVVRNLGNFDQYTKHDVKRRSIIKEDSYARKCGEMHSIAEARLQSLEGKVFELKRKGDILLEKGKRS